jgi:hypothetical protein
MSSSSEYIRRPMRRLFWPLLALAGLVLALPGVAAAQQGQAQVFRADLAPLNNSGGAGNATIEVNDGTVNVTVNTRGVSPNLPHAQHIHIGGSNECPPPTASGDDELISTAEGQPFYGGVHVSLTTEGDVGAGSALAVERFPVATNGGTVNYQRTFELPDGVTVDDLSQGVIVQHGISKLFADETQYDGEPRSSLDESLPLEATIPTVCGKLTAAGAQAQGQTPRGGVAAGFGGTSADAASIFTILSGAAMLFGGAALMRRRFS